MRRIRNFPLLLGLVIVLMAIAACSGDDAPPAADPAQADPAAQTGETATDEPASEDAEPPEEEASETEAAAGEAEGEPEAAEMEPITAAELDAATQCATDELVYFSCQNADGAAMIDLCASADFDGVNGYLEFRHPTQLQYRYPHENGEPFKYARDGENQTLSFTLGSEQYELSTSAEAATLATFNTEDKNDGGVVSCTQPIFNQLALLEPALTTIEYRGTPILDQVEEQMMAAETEPSEENDGEPATAADSYTVRAGDTLLSISAALGVDWRTVAELNDLTFPYTIYVGDQLEIPETATADVRTYTVAAGDTLVEISEAAGVSWVEVANINGLRWPYWVYVGQELILPAE